MGEMIAIETLDHDGSFNAYCATPPAAPKAAILVIQEIFGVNAGIRAKCDAWAAQGYLAVAPDLFWRMEPGIELDADKPDDLNQAFEYYGKFDQTLAIRDIEATIRAARARANGGKVGLVGYCLGGRLAFMSATRTDVDASVGYYGVGIDGLLNESHAIANPLLLHFAALDHFVSAEAVETVKAGLADNRHVDIHVYPGVDHGFAATSGARRVEDAAQLADGRTADFFATHLG